MPPTTMAGAGGDPGQGSAAPANGSATGDEVKGDVEAQLDKLELAAKQLEKLANDDIAKLPGKGSDAVKPPTPTPPTPTPPTPTPPTPTPPTPTPSGGGDIDKKIAAYSSGEPACDDFIRVMYAASKCDKLASSADSMRSGLLRS